MAFDTGAAAEGYKSALNSYKNKIKNIQNRLNSDFNFDKSPSDESFFDFWEGLTDNMNIGDRNYNQEFNTIVTISQEQNDLIDAKYMNILGMVQMLDSYMCYITDAYSRMIDIAWSCGLGGIYLTQFGKDLPNGEREIVKKGVQFYTNGINDNLLAMNDLISSMDITRNSDTQYLNIKREVFLKHIRNIEKLVNDVETEISTIIDILQDNDKALKVWILECFNMVANITLTFNLNQKNLKVAQKPISIGNAFNMNTRVAISIAKYWREEKLLPDRTNQAECIVGAIKQGLLSIPEPNKIEKLKDFSWDLMIPKY